MCSFIHIFFSVNFLVFSLLLQLMTHHSRMFHFNSYNLSCYICNDRVNNKHYQLFSIHKVQFLFFTMMIKKFEAIASTTPTFASCTPSKYHNVRNNFVRIFKRRVTHWVLLSGVDAATVVVGAANKASRRPWWWVLQIKLL